MLYSDWIRSRARCIQSLMLCSFDYFIGGQIKRKSTFISVIRLDKIGDFILWLDSAKTLRGLYPGQRIILIANSTWAELAEKLPYWDEVWSVDYRRLMRSLIYRWQIMRKIRQQGFDIAIHPTFSRHFPTGDSVVRATGARERIGFAGDENNSSSWQKLVSDRWYTRLMPANPLPMMEIERNAEFVRLLGINNYDAAVPLLPIVATLPDALRIKKPYFIVFPGASWSGKQWPIESYVALVRNIHTNTGWQPVVCGSSGERGLCSMLSERTLPPALNLAGQTSLPQFAEVVRGASLLIGNDTSAIHIAAAVETPSVCILGGGHFGRFLPYPENLPGCRPVAVYREMACFGCNWRCNQPHTPNGPVPCISSISVDAVIASANQALSYGSCKIGSESKIREKS